MLGLLALNDLKTTDIIFFIALAAIIVIAIAVYFLIPVFNKKQYKEQRDNLRKREVVFKSNIQRTDGKVTEPQTDAEPQAEPQSEPQTTQVEPQNETQIEPQAEVAPTADPSDGDETK